jgi:hypothetical protein
MHVWFQNLNENRRQWFAFRGSLGRDWNRKWFKYEISSGPALRFTVDAFEGKTRLAIGMGFFSLYLTIYGLTIPFIRKGERHSSWGREYGFYWHEWILWAFFGRDPMGSSSKDPWYYSIVIHPLDILFGRTVYFETGRQKSHDPIHFEFRGRRYQMDEIQVNDAYWFKPRIPFALYRKKVPRMHLKIERPPGYAGKGENSWDCGDDASYGLTCPYEGPMPSWQNRDAVFERCVRVYCDHVSKSIKRYGRSSGDEAPNDEVAFKYIGRIRQDDGAVAVRKEPAP